MTLCKRPSAHTPIHFPLPPAHFQRNPPGRGRLAVFPPPWHRDKDYGNWNKNEPIFKLPVFIYLTRKFIDIV
jgi:hypothetical protein